MFSKRRKQRKSGYYIVLGLVVFSSLFSLYGVLHPKSQSKAIKITIIDGERLWKDLPAIKQLKKSANTILSSQQKSFSKVEAELREENQELIELQNSYSAKDYSRQKEIDKKQKQFTKRVVGVQAQAEEAQRKVNEAYQKAMLYVRGHVTRAIHRIAHKKGSAIVIYKNQSPYHDSALDITDEVFDQLKNLEAPKIAI